MSLITVIFSFLLSIHQSLYFPKFPSIPVIRMISEKPQTTLTLPVKKLTGTQVPPIEAGAFLVIDQNSGEVLAENKADLELPPASTTKIMTAVVILEQFNLNQQITIPSDFPKDNNLGLKRGEIYFVNDLLRGVLVHSSNEAAELLASNFVGGRTAFIAAMNAKAKQLGMIHTHYSNPTGLPENGHVMTVRDLLILARYAMKLPTFAGDVGLQTTTLTTVDGKARHQTQSTNLLLGKVSGIEGIKTGYTEEAGECLVTQVTRDGHTILTALLRSPDRFRETETLINWVFDGFHWETKPLSQW